MKTPHSQLVIRPVDENDLDGLMTLLGSVPDSVTSLQPDEQYLQKRIDHSLRSFYPVIHEPGLERYFFVLEDLANERLAGTCSIYARTGGFEPFYTYEVFEKEHRHDPLKIVTRISELHLRLDHEGPSELAGLFLHPGYRESGIGGALSRSRFLFAKLFPDRFTEKILTEFRGVVSQSGEVPFWEAIGRHFFVRDFFTLDQYSALARKDFIHDLMPRHPIYVPLLPKKAQDVIGKPHPAAEPAVHVLEKEGFRYVNRVDIFDAGPIYEATLTETVSFDKSRLTRVGEIADDVKNEAVLTANTQLEFRACLARIRESDKGGDSSKAVVLEKCAAERLQVEPGDEVIYLPSTKKRKPSK